MKLRIIHDKYLEKYFVQKKVLWWYKNITWNGSGFDTLESAAYYEKQYIEDHLKNIRKEHQDKLDRTAKNRLSLIKEDNIKIAYLYFQTPE